MSALGMRLLRVLRPPGDRRRDERGRCSACGAETRFVFNSWLLPPDADDEWGDWTEEFARRETMICSSCSATLRVRRLADVLIEHYGQGAGCLAELVEEPRFRELDVAEVNSIGALHPLLARLPKLRYSEYGAGTVPSEDLTSLSYGDGSLDLVLTSETFEHVPDWRRALAETRRVLRPGGRHVFTVPLVPTRPATEDVGDRGWHHARGRGPFRLVGRHGDMLVRTEFGTDLLDALRNARFEPELHFEGDVASVFCARAV
jgi:SAM-dependent methyltransferase